MSDPDLLSQIMAIYDVPEELRDWITTPDPWRLKEERYIAALPGRLRDIADEVNERFADVLPEGMRFEWDSVTVPVPLQDALDLLEP